MVTRHVNDGDNGGDLDWLPPPSRTLTLLPESVAYLPDSDVNVKNIACQEPVLTRSRTRINSEVKHPAS